MLRELGIPCQDYKVTATSYMERTFKPRDTLPWQSDSEDLYLLKLHPSRGEAMLGGGPGGSSLGQPPERQICPAENALPEEPLDTPRPFQYKLRFEFFIRNHANFNTKNTSAIRILC